MQYLPFWQQATIVFVAMAQMFSLSFIPMGFNAKRYTMWTFVVMPLSIVAYAYVMIQLLPPTFAVNLYTTLLTLAVGMIVGLLIAAWLVHHRDVLRDAMRGNRHPSAA